MVRQPNPDLVRYIEKHIKKGFKIPHIKRKLAEVGHPIEAIEDAARFVVLQKTPRKKVPAFMIVYGIILILVLAGFAWFVWFKASQQIEYEGIVKDVEENRSYLGQTDVQLIKMAAGGDVRACDFIRDHNIFYACKDRYWERDDCEYEALVGDADSCLFDYAKKKDDFASCGRIADEIQRLHCTRYFSAPERYANITDPADCSDPACATALFERQPSKKICDLFYDNSDEALSSCYEVVAKRTGNSAMCDSIKTREEKFNCKAFFAASFQEIYSLCESYEDMFKEGSRPVFTLPKRPFIAGSNAEFCFFDTVKDLKENLDTAELEIFVNSRGLHNENLMILDDYILKTHEDGGI
ncbi:hypothetical protein ACFL3V_01840 [Nanoarchaeota archaeon]